MLKILKGLRFETKSSIKQFFLDMSSFKHDIYRVMEQQRNFEDKILFSSSRGDGGKSVSRATRAVQVSMD